MAEWLNGQLDSGVIPLTTGNFQEVLLINARGKNGEVIVTGTVGEEDDLEGLRLDRKGHMNSPSIPIMEGEDFNSLSNDVIRDIATNDHTITQEAPANIHLTGAGKTFQFRLNLGAASSYTIFAKGNDTTLQIWVRDQQ